MSKLRQNSNLLYITLFLVLILALWTGFSLIPQPEKVDLPNASGFCDLSGGDFEDTIYRYVGEWETYPEKLYTPEDFAGGAATGRANVQSYRTIQFATYRLRLTLPPGQTYGISLTSSDYSMRIFIGGAKTDSVGVPGSTRESTVQ
jgi:hypothetical protein